MNNKGIVFFDVDGTLIDWTKKIYDPTERTKLAIEKLRENGYLTVLATGRPMNSVHKGLLDLGLNGYVASNGAYLEINNKVLFNETLNNDELKELLDFLEENNVVYMLEGQEYNYVLDIGNEKLSSFLEAANLDKNNFREDWDKDTVKVNKIIAIAYDGNSFNLVFEKFKEKDYAFMSNQSNGGVFEIYKAKYTKGYGIEQLLNLLDISKDKAYAFGDGENDIEMFQVVKYGIAMGDYHERLKKYAYDLTENVENEGIEKGLKRLGLI
ncbi:MAG: HAD family hydrolase [Clostridium sp.]|uniref:HAD family hydrolase n=1 Tax=Clostridium sp. TaxID=1506 RepID=UPI0025BA30BF|nr:HAD family hydrolase [Clostridium sp.]MCF0146894.1 HAD family hydrolase [Clostridium sp.]